jgi:mono/diheme cytochrome c family protein
MNPETNKAVAPAADSPESPGKSTWVPVWLIVLMALLLWWGMFYFDEHGGWFSPQIYAPYRSVADLEPFQQLHAPEDPRSRGRKVFNLPSCVTCHQATGLGTPGTFPPLAGSDWVNEKEPGRIIRAVLNGLQGPITVNGQTFNNTMVAWNTLTDEQIADVISYVRSEWGNKASEVTPEQVAAVRAKLKAQGRTPNSPFTPDELLKISPAD